MRPGFRVTEMYAWLMIDNDMEGVPAAKMGEMAMPLMGANLETVKMLKPWAESAAKMAGKSIVLARFSVREDIETINGGKT